MELELVNELKEVLMKEKKVEEILYSMIMSPNAISLKVEFENTDLEYYPQDKDVYEIEPVKAGLIIYLEHELKHCQIRKQQIVQEMANRVLLPEPNIIYMG